MRFCKNFQLQEYKFPGGKSVSFHTDKWYGHGDTVSSFWLPLTPVFEVIAFIWQKT